MTWKRKFLQETSLKLLKLQLILTALRQRRKVTFLVVLKNTGKQLQGLFFLNIVRMIIMLLLTVKKIIHFLDGQLANGEQQPDVYFKLDHEYYCWRIA